MQILKFLTSAVYLNLAIILHFIRITCLNPSSFSFSKFAAIFLRTLSLQPQVFYLDSVSLSTQFGTMILSPCLDHFPISCISEHIHNLFLPSSGRFPSPFIIPKLHSSQDQSSRLSTHTLIKKSVFSGMHTNQVQQVSNHPSFK